MIRNRIFLKAIAIFLIVETLVNTVAPTISWALTAGPTAPEATSFEPVDTTDMVNLFTGDLAYNTPLLEVPGPNGGYPLSLSYHAGIQPDVEASWVGLGWSLNPGAITRIVNGYADDHDGPGMEITNHFHWDGETRTTYTLGVTVPIGGAAGVTAGLSFTEDSQYGFSVNPFIGGELKLPGGVGISANSVSGTAKLSAPGLSYLNALDNVKNVIKTKSYDQHITSIGPLSLDMNLSSKGIKPKLSVSGFERGVYREGKVNRISSSSGVNFKVGGIGVNIQRTYTRVWIDETATVNTNGALHFRNTEPSSYTSMDFQAYDTYDLFYDDGNYSVQQKDPQLNSDGSFADYDDFNVNAQGLNGSIRPYHYYEYLLHQNRKDDDKDLVILRSVPMGAVQGGVRFRFMNDFSNRFLFDPPKPVLSLTGGYNESETVTGIDMVFDTTNITAGLDGQGYANRTLAGSKHIQTFDNRAIVNRITGPPEGFIECTAEGFARDGFTVGRGQIGSFRITNESGVTYHFSLPAYSSSEKTYTEKIEATSLTYSEVEKEAPYAYTWYLTAITGPDYVDRGGSNGEPNGKLDESDYGYWVDFGYRKWNGEYYWRNPVEGFNLDLDNNFKSYSTGKKEVYYLDYIRTASHILIFDKHQRHDGHGVMGTAGGYSTVPSTSVARLDNVYLLNIDDFDSLGTNVLDSMSAYRSQVLAASIRSASFEYDYSLCRNTPNSFSTSISQKEGKLTLTALTFRGKGGAEAIIPLLKFGYELEKPAKASVYLDIDHNRFSLPDSPFKTGDIIRISQGTSTVYALLNFISPSWEHLFTIIDGSSSSLEANQAMLEQTKNPPYNKDKHDAWGLYKSDFIAGVTSEARITTPISAQNVDVWSLRTIKTPTGGIIQIDYEADYYDEVVLASSELDGDRLVSQQALRIKSVNKLPNYQFELFFYDEGYDLSDVFEVDDHIPVYLMGAYKATDLTLTDGAPPGCDCPSIGYAYHDVYDVPTSSIVEAIHENTHSIVISNGPMTGYFSKSSLSTVDLTTPCSSAGDFPSCAYDVQSDWVSFFAGGIAYAASKPKYAGGIRVKNVSLVNLNKVSRLNYNYGTGVTSYEPVSMMAFKLNPDYYAGLGTEARSEEYQEAEMKLKKYSFKHYSNLLHIVREVPAPGVMYRTVDVRTFVADENQETEQQVFQRFDFQTFSKGMIHYEKTKTPRPEGTVADLSVDRSVLSVVTLDDLTQAIGNLKSILTYDQQGKLMSAKRYSYLHDEYLSTLEDGSGYSNYKTLLQNKINSQGVMNESFSEARIVLDENITGDRVLIGITSKRRTYPSVQIKESTIDYTTGIETSVETQGFDFFSGEETRTLTIDGYGNSFLHEVVPAYTEYPEMGLGMNGKRNMLMQHAAEYAFKIDPAKTPADPGYKLGLVSASAQTWSNEIPVISNGGLSITQTAVWRKSSNYQFVGSDQVSLPNDGLYPYENFVSFSSWDDENVPDTWQKNSGTTLYDTYSHDLEHDDINHQYLATKFSNDQQLAFATIANAEYREFAYSGAEETPSPDHKFGGGVVYGNGGLTSTAHTGSKAVVSSESTPAFTYSFTPKQRTYRVSVWSSQPTASIQYAFDGGALESLAVKHVGQAGSWYLLEADVEVTEALDVLSIQCGAASGTSYFDDFRVCPVDAAMSSYVYNQWGEVSHILDNNNLYTKYTYDNMGRLKETFKETLNEGSVRITEVKYHYANQPNDQ